MSGTVYVVHAVDTEGPLYESLQATFERLKNTFNLDLPVSYANLEKLRRKEIDLAGKEEIVAKFVDPKLLSYQTSWDRLESLMENIMSDAFRNQVVDSDGNGWIFNWYCLDHVMYEVNPRRRDIGYHNIHDRYLEFVDKFQAHQDAIEWHFHPMSTYREAHRCATSYENSPHLHQVLCRRIIERNFFPSSYRAGFQTERPDSNWFLEQWIPFDCSSMAVEDYSEFEAQADFKNGRSGDWRGAPTDWSIYHPDLYDYRKPGNLKRWIARFLNLNTRLANIDQEEVDKAFLRAQNGQDTLLGVANHDWRDVAHEVNIVRDLLSDASARFPDVPFKFSKTKDAFNQIVNEGNYEKLELSVELKLEEGNYHLYVDTNASEVFGPQPYLAIKTKSGRFIHDNFDFSVCGKSWSYVFDAETVLSSDLDTVGVAANNKFGDTFIKVISVE